MHILSLFTLAILAVSAFSVTASPTGINVANLIRRDLYSLTELELEKRGCTKPCPGGQHREACQCVDNPPIVNECPQVCISKPYAPASPFGHEQKEVICPESKLSVAAGPSNVIFDAAQMRVHWDMPNGGVLFRDRKGDERFDGSLTEAGELKMGSYGKITVGFKYVVGLKVGSWIYYYSLKGFSNCDTSAPNAKDLFTLVESVTVHDAGF